MTTDAAMLAEGEGDSADSESPLVMNSRLEGEGLILLWQTDAKDFVKGGRA